MGTKAMSTDATRSVLGLGAPSLGVQNLSMAARVPVLMPTASKPNEDAISIVAKWPARRHKGFTLAAVNRTDSFPCLVSWRIEADTRPLDVAQISLLMSRR